MGYKVYSLTDGQVARINSELLKYNDRIMEMYMFLEGKTFKFLDYSKAYVLTSEIRGQGEEWHILYYSDYEETYPIEEVSVNCTNGIANVGMWAGAFVLASHHREKQRKSAVAIPKNDYDRIISLIREGVERRKRDVGSLF